MIPPMKCILLPKILSKINKRIENVFLLHLATLTFEFLSHEMEVSSLLAGEYQCSILCMYLLAKGHWFLGCWSHFHIESRLQFVLEEVAVETQLCSYAAPHPSLWNHESHPSRLRWISISSSLNEQMNCNTGVHSHFVTSEGPSSQRERQGWGQAPASLQVPHQGSQVRAHQMLGKTLLWSGITGCCWRLPNWIPLQEHFDVILPYVWVELVEKNFTFLKKKNKQRKQLFHLLQMNRTMEPPGLYSISPSTPFLAGVPSFRRNFPVLCGNRLGWLGWLHTLGDIHIFWSWKPLLSIGGAAIWPHAAAINECF